MKRRYPALAWLQVILAIVVLLTGCTSRGGTPTPSQPGSSGPGSVSSGSASAGAVPIGGSSVAPRSVSYQPGGQQPGGLQMKLGEGSEGASTGPAAPVAPASPAPASAVQAVLGRLQPLQPVPGDQQAFNRPPASLPAPRPGKTVTETFGAATPSGVEPSPVATGPLEVVRHSPDGPVPLAPYLSVTFNQPMVALTSVDDLAAGSVPVQLEPRVSGKWRWVGTQTLMFEPEGSAKTSTGEASTAPGRFPMSTYYTATIPAGTTSANGGKLAQEVRFTFNTPPVTVESSFPTGGPQRLDPILFASFDQRIDSAAVLKAVQVTAGGKSFEVRQATAEEIKADQAVSRLSQGAADGRWLAFKAGQPFPADTDVTVTFPKGTPSAEGPRRTDKSQSFTFHTYGPFRLAESRCGYDQTCRPLQPWYIRFTNPIDADAFSDASLKISPDLPGAKISAMGDMIQIQGATQGRTTYKVTLRADIKDTFGQQLGSDQTVTFNVGSSDPMLAGPGRTFVVLDPSSQKPNFAVYSINVQRLKVTVQTVTPDDWPAWLTYQQNLYQTNAKPAVPGKPAFSKTINVEAKADQLAETDIDLGQALTNGLGQVVIVVDADPPLDARLGKTTVFAWVQSTHIALDALVDGDQMVAWANALSDGKPLGGVQLSLVGQSSARSTTAATATTGTDGVVNLGLPESDAANLLVARQGQDTAILPENEYYWAAGKNGWQRRASQDEIRWYVFDDRNLYKPGEEVQVKGWVRQIAAGKGGDVALPSNLKNISVTYTLNDARGNKLTQGRLALNALAGFTTAFTIPQGTNLGTAVLQLTLQGASTPNGRDYSLPIQVQEFRRPEYEVKASAGEGPFFVGGSALVTAAATYYAGGGLPNAQVDWQVTSQPGNFTPPNWSDYTFGLWTPWWDIGGFRPGGYTPPNVQSYTGYTDGNGVHRLNIDFQSIDTPQPMTVNAQATIMDVNRQAWTASANLLVHPADLYVGLRSDRMFVEKGQPLPVDAIVVDLDGNVVPGVQIKMRAARLDWKYQNGQYQQVEAAVQPCTVTSGKDPVRCTFETGEGGTYRIDATIQDDKGRANLTQITRWVSGGGRPPSRNVEQEQATLIPDRKDYQPGDTAEILVQAPFSPAEGLVTLQRGGIVSTQRFTMTGPSYTLKVPIVEGYIPNVIVQVDLVGASARLNDAGEEDPKLPKRPAFARGELDLSVPPLARALAVTATPREAALDPGGKTSIDLLVKDAKGQPVAGAEMAVVVVDEAVLALTNYKLSDPLDIIYSHRGSNTQDYHSRNDVVLSNPLSLAGQSATDTAKMAESAANYGGIAPMAAAPAPAATVAAGARSLADSGRGGGGAEPAPIAVRSDFNALAVFSATVPTDNQGRAVVPVKLPDNLTRYRVMAVAVADGKQFGMGESAITARLPLMVRPSAPRFLNFGDRFELPVVLQNQTGHPMTVTVAARAANALFIRSDAVRSASAGYTVTVPANNRVEVRFPTTTDRPGTARFQFGATAGSAADAAEISLPVYTPATTEAFATYGVIDGAAGSSSTVAQPVIMPTNVYTQFGGLQVTTSSTALQALTDAFLYLNSYPFECSEQLASRILSVAALRDVLTAFQAPGLPSPEEIQAAVTRDVNRLVAMQNADGGWPVWRRGDDSWPFYTIHVTHALVVAQQKGFDVPQAAIDQALPYLQNVESHIPSWYGEMARRSLIAYSLYVRNLAGNKDTGKARQLVNDSFQNVGQGGPQNLSPEAVGWLLSVLTGDSGSSKELGTLRQYLGNRVVETAGAANFVTNYGDDNYLLLGSDRRADAIILNALIVDQPKSDLIVKLVNGLLAQRKAGRWGNTQENLFVLLALDRYFNTYEAQTPDFVARLWLGDTYAGDHAFKGRTTERSEIDVPMSYLAGAGSGPQNLILSKDGTGRLYYRLGMSYAPNNLDLKPSDNGFTVERVYEWIDDPKDVTRDANGTWHIRAGARVRVRLTLVAPSRRYHVALVDPLPAGLEPLNPALATTGSVPGDQGPVPIAATGSAPGVRGGPVAPAAAPAVASVLPGRPVWNWWRWWTWYEHQNLRDDRAEAFTSLLWEGVYTYTYVARATTPGTFVVPPAKAEEMYAPETFGRSATAHVVVE